MQVKEKLIKEIDKLDSREIFEIYNFILILRNSKRTESKLTTSQGYLRVRNALKNYRGKLSDEIIARREERL